EILLQSDASDAPGPSQRNQRYVYWIGVVPVQVPRDVLSTWPTRGVPVIRGSTVFVGTAEVAAPEVSAAQAAKRPPTTASAAAAPSTPRYARYSRSVRVFRVIRRLPSFGFPETRPAPGRD